MKAPIAHRPVTGARRILRRPSPPRGRGPLRRPLALLYRQSAKARSAAPAAVRAADGRSVSLAPRLQIALHLSFMLNEQHRAYQVPAATFAPVAARLAAPAQRQAWPSRHLSSVEHWRRMDAVGRTPVGAPIGSSPSFEHRGARGDAGPPGRHAVLACAGSGFRPISLSSVGRPGRRSAGSASHAAAAPPWPLREAAGAARLAPIPGNRPDHRRLLVTRLGNGPALVRAGAAARHDSSDASTYRIPSTAEHRGGGGHIDAAVPGRHRPQSQETSIKGGDAVSLRTRSRARGMDASAAGPSGTRSRETSTKGGDAVSLRVRNNARAIDAAAAAPSGTRSQETAAKGGNSVSLRVRNNARGIDAAAAGASGTRSQETSTKGGGAVSLRMPGDERLRVSESRIRLRLPSADLHRAGLAPGRAARPDGTNGTVPGSAQTGLRSISRRLPSVMALASSLSRPERARAPRAADRPSIAMGAPAGRGSPAPLHLAGRQSGRTTAPAPFSSDRAPPPLDFRSAEAPPAPPPPAEARPAATTAPPAAPIDLGAVSRDVISRIEKRLRVERERRGRS